MGSWKRHSLLPCVLSCAQGLALLVGCSAEIGSPAGPPGIVTDPPIPGGPTDREYEPLVPAPAAMQRLTQAQYANSITDIFGASVLPTSPLPLDNHDEEFLSVGSTFVASADGAVERYRDAAVETAEAILAQRMSFDALASCTPTDPTDSCIADAVRHYGRLLWRRALSEEEVVRHAAIAQAAGSGAENAELGFKYALASLLSAPSFMYLAFSGEDDVRTGGKRYTSVEMASRLSYFLWDSAPDDALLQVAESGELTDPQTIRTQVERMLEEPRASDLAERFFFASWNIEDLNAASKDTSIFPEWSSSLADSAKTEFTMVLDDLAWTPGESILDIFSSRDTYVNQDLGPLYGVTVGGDSFERVTLDETRAGLFTSVAALAANSKPQRTSPTQRGVFVRANVLCLPVPPPPDDIDFELGEDGSDDLSIRDQLELHRADPTCASCHELFDPMGMTLENFDTLGRYREQDQGFDIDPVSVFEGQTFASARDLAEFIRSDERTASCLAERVYSFATGHVPTPGEQGVMQALSDYFVSEGEAFKELIVGVTISTGFRYLGEEAAP